MRRILIVLFIFLVVLVVGTLYYVDYYDRSYQDLDSTAQELVPVVHKDTGACLLVTPNFRFRSNTRPAVGVPCTEQFYKAVTDHKLSAGAI